MSTSVTLGARFLCLALAGAGALAWFVDSPALARAPQLRAEGDGPLVDTDGDLLPDMLELSAITDPLRVDTNGNGASDFLDVVQHIAPRASNRMPRPLDHEARVMVSGFQRADGQVDVWVHLLLRFVGTQVGALQQLEPFLDVQGLRVPLFSIFQQTPTDFGMQVDPVRGTMIRVSTKLCTARDLGYLLPCTIGARVVIDSRTITTGTYLARSAEVPVILTPWSDTEFCFQTLADDAMVTSFWRRNKLCLMTLTIVGSGLGGQVGRIDQAECEISDGLKCPPDCSNGRGSLLFLPDGLITITGG